MDSERDTSAGRIIFTVGAISAGLGVALGAFAAHALRSRLPADMVAVFETGVRYQVYHAFGMLAAGWADRTWGGNRRFALAGWSFAVGTLLFSGSLYILAVTGTAWVGAITPAGGLFFIAGWGVLASAVWQHGRN